MRFSHRRECPDHPALRRNPVARGLLQIEGVEGPCLVYLKTCGNPRCTCGEVRLEVVEVTPEGDDKPGGLYLCAQVTALSRAIAGPPELTAAQRALAAEIASAIPDDELDPWQRTFEDRAATGANLARARIKADDVRTGVLQSWIHHASADKDVFSGQGQQVAGSLVHEGRQWLFDVLYCPNPACDCRSFHVEGYTSDEHGSDGTGVLACQFRVQGWFDRPDLKVTWRWRKARVDPLAVAGAWLDDRKRRWFPAQYEDIRAIGARSLGAGSATRRPSPALASRVGRNEACPCGSGEKYKRCCGRG